MIIKELDSLYICGKMRLNNLKKNLTGQLDPLLKQKPDNKFLTSRKTWVFRFFICIKPFL